MLVSFALVALVPLIFLGVKLYNVAWEEAWREITEKHQLLAQNLAAPISIYVEDQKTSLEQLGGFIRYVTSDKPFESLLEKQSLPILGSMKQLTGFRSVSLVDLNGKIVLSTRGQIGQDKLKLFENESCYVNTRRDNRWFLSGVKAGPFDGLPAILMSSPIYHANGEQAAVLMAELRIDLIEDLRRRIKFGKKGHSAIMDHKGRVVAHPNPNWMAEMKDLSPWPITQKMMKGETGVTEFYSPFIKASMVAGYAAVPGINWGIMVPQPKPEVEERVNRILHAQLLWGLIGLAMALFIAYLLTRWILAPLKKMNAAVNHMVSNGFHGELEELSRHAPRELHVLRRCFNSLVSGLQWTRNELDDMNHSLQRRVDEATQELRGANKQLQIFASQDYLTKLYNRRYFESTLLQKIPAASAEGRDLCLMMIDVDNFKMINDEFGHAAGDHALIKVANLINDLLGKDHLIARYAGDEFVVLVEDGIQKAEPLAEQLLLKVSQTSFYWHGEQLRVTLSIGLYHQRDSSQYNMDSLLNGADQALYNAKERGRNRVTVNEK